MFNAPKALSRRESPKGLEYFAMIVAATFDTVRAKDVLALAGAMFLMGNAAEKAVDFRANYVAHAEAKVAMDPIIAEVGGTQIHLSDARALAEKTGTRALNLTGGMASTLVEDLTDQAALAEVARADGLGEALEIKAEIALAQREILSRAYLELAIRNAVTDDAVDAAYRAALAGAENNQRLSMRRIVVASEAEAVIIRGRIRSGEDFDEYARRRSLDMSSRAAGGDLGVVTLGSLPAAEATVVSTLPLGEVSEPVETPQGWSLVVVDMRQSVRMPTFSEMRDGLERQMRNEVIEQSIALARAENPARTVITPVDHGSMVLPTALAISSAW